MSAKSPRGERPQGHWHYSVLLTPLLLLIVSTAFTQQGGQSNVGSRSSESVSVRQIHRNADAVVDMIPGVSQHVTGIVLVCISRDEIIRTNFDPHEHFSGPGPAPQRIGGNVMIMDRLESPTPTRQPETVLDLYGRIDKSQMTTPEEFCEALNAYRSGYEAVFHAETGKILIWEDGLPQVIRERLETPAHEFLTYDSYDRARATKREILTLLHERVGYHSRRGFERETQPQEFLTEDGRREVAPPRWSNLDQQMTIDDVSERTALDVMLVLLRSEDGEDKNRSHVISISDPHVDFTTIPRDHVSWHVGIMGSRPEREALGRALN